MTNYPDNYVDLPCIGGCGAWLKRPPHIKKARCFDCKSKKQRAYNHLNPKPHALKEEEKEIPPAV